MKKDQRHTSATAQVQTNKYHQPLYEMKKKNKNNGGGGVLY